MPVGGRPLRLFLLSAIDVISAIGYQKMAQHTRGFRKPMSAIVPIRPGVSLPAALALDLTRAAELAREEKAAATRRAYRSDFRIFEAWCRSHGVNALPAPPESVAAFLAHDVENGSRPSTLGRRLAAIRYAHKLAGHDAPTDDERVKATMRGIRRSLGTALRKKAPATAERIISMALAAGDDMKGLRDRALLLIGFAGAFRRSELVALNIEDLEESELGFKVTIRHSKTDQEGAGQTIAIVRGSVACPVVALKAWPPGSPPGRYSARSRKAAG
jgi:integrase